MTVNVGAVYALATTLNINQKNCIIIVIDIPVLTDVAESDS